MEKKKNSEKDLEKYIQKQMIQERKEKELKRTKERPTKFTKLILIFEFCLFIISLFFLAIGLKVFLGVFLMGSFLFFLVFTLISLFSKRLRSTFWLPNLFIFCIMSLVVFIAVVNIPFIDKNAQAEVLPAEEVVYTELPAEEAAEEPPEEVPVQESESTFSFSKYINESKVKEYEMIKEEDISIRALGDKLPSEFTATEIEKLPKNYRMKYSIVVPRDITEEELKSTFAQIIKDKSTENTEIDEIYVAAWYFKESVGKTASMGSAEWCPNGKWEELPPEIAEYDIRNSYKIVFYNINIQAHEGETKYGLTESERMQAFYDLVVLQDLIPFDDPEWEEKNDESYVIIADKYGITRDQMFEIGVEGVTKGWPVPPLEE